MSNIAVSIFLLTYNQEEFITKTIESILCQKTNFRYQLVIGEDLSADSTRQICEKFAEDYPNKVKLLPSTKRHGLINNFMRTIKECDGRYIAVCDGDDYWVDPLKLQKQFDFMKSNPDHSIVYTGIKNLYPNGEYRNKTWCDNNYPRQFEELIFGNFIPSVTAFYRNKRTNEDWPSWITKFPYGDWPVYLFLTRNGEKIGYLNEITGVYRKEIGVSERLKIISSDIAKVNLEIVENVYNDDNFKEKINIVEKSLEKHKFGLMGSYFREGKILYSFRLAGDLVRKKPGKVIRSYAYLIKKTILKHSDT